MFPMRFQWSFFNTRLLDVEGVIKNCGSLDVTVQIFDAGRRVQEKNTLAYSSKRSTYCQAVQQTGA